TAVGVALACGATVIVFVLSYYTELLAAVRNIPGGGYFWDTFGARQLPGGIGYVLQPILTETLGTGWASAAASGRSLILVIASLLIASLCSFIAWTAYSAERRHYVAALRQMEGGLLQIGAALVVGWFF